MNLRHFIFTFVLFIATFDIVADDNVVISSHDETYTMNVDGNGLLSNVKMARSSTYLATRADDSHVAIEFYGTDIRMDKASAPGSKAIYRAWEDDDLFYDGSRVCALPLSLVKGKPLTAKFEKTYVAPEQFCTIMLAKASPVKKGHFEIVVPALLANIVKVTPLDLPQGTSVVRSAGKNGAVVYDVDVTDLPAYKHEAQSASPYECAPRLIVTGQFTSPHAMYRFLKSHVRDEGIAPEVKDLADKLTSGCIDDIARIDTISSWVRQNIRYVAVEHGAYGVMPDLAASVLDKRYGDCKGSANLIRQLLRASGIDSRLVWTGTNGHVAGRFSDYPCMGAGNHMVAAAIVGDSTIIIDGTTTYSPRGYVPRSLGGAQAMIEDGDKCILLDIPSHDDSTDYIAIGGRFTSDDESLSGSFSYDLRGEERMFFENACANISASRRPEFYARYFKPSQTARHSNVEISTAAPNAISTYVSLDETDKGAVTVSSSKTYLCLRPWRLLRYTPVTDKERRNPLHTETQHIISSMEFEIPEGYDVPTLPSDFAVDNDWFEGRLSYTADGPTIKVEGFIRCKSPNVALNRIPEWNASVREIARANTTPIVICKK